jgi:UDP-N-acetylmuramoyl-L-alanyl-D-glutamate--2,6-diaminopimelate ligase
MKLTTLLAALPWPVARPADDPEIAGVTSDSRRVQPGMLFVAYPGVTVDGHRFIPDALACGAAAVVGSAPPGDVPAGAPYVQVPDARAAFGWLCAAWRDFPARRMCVIGVTGTDGKTTTTNLIAAILGAAGRRASLISTVYTRIGERVYDTGLHTTTPPADEIQAHLVTMVAAGTTHAVLEVTSEGLAQQRVAGVDFDVAVITNITRDHLYAHGTYEAYREAKAMLFRGLEHAARKPDVPKIAVLNRDDSSFGALVEATRFLHPPVGQRLTYGLDTPADVMGFAVDLGASDLRFTCGSPYGAIALAAPLIGRFNVYNVLAASAAALALGCDLPAVRAGVASLPAIPGRMERVEAGQPFAALVDFAHNAYALDAALAAARLLCAPGGRVIVVFGATGERDTAKRPEMGRVAGRRADLVVLTSDDPRREKPEDIIAAVAVGCEAEGRRDGESYWRVPDRAEAIALGVRLARPGDALVLAGMGHLQSMAMADGEMPWDDRVALRRALTDQGF